MLERALPIVRERTDIGAYRDHLGFLLGFHAPVEAHLVTVRALREWLPDLDQRWKSPLLRTDLAGHAEAGRGEAERIPQPPDAVSSLGVVYVLEGATLGARTLLKALRSAGTLPGPVGSGYLEGYGRRTAAMWRLVGEALESVPAQRHADVIDAARETFHSLLDWRSAWARRG